MSKVLLDEADLADQADLFVVRVELRACWMATCLFFVGIGRGNSPATRQIAVDFILALRTSQLSSLSMLIPLSSRYTDYDTKGHVNNAIYLTYFEIARAHAWRELVKRSSASPVAHRSNFTDEPQFILAEATVRYVSAAMIGESLEIEIRIAEIRTKAWVWEYVIRCVDDGRTIAEGKTAQVWFDYEARKSVPIPEEMRTALEASD